MDSLAEKSLYFLWVIKRISCTALELVEKARCQWDDSQLVSWGATSPSVFSSSKTNHPSIPFKKNTCHLLPQPTNLTIPFSLSPKKSQGKIALRVGFKNTTVFFSTINLPNSFALTKNTSFTFRESLGVRSQATSSSNILIWRVAKKTPGYLLHRWGYTTHLYGDFPKRNRPTWNPNDPYFDWKRPCFGGVQAKKSRIKQVGTAVSIMVPVRDVPSPKLTSRPWTWRFLLIFQGLQLVGFSRRVYNNLTTNT